MKPATRLRPLSMLLQDAGVEVPVICGAMYPCSNPELVAAVSAAGGLGVIQPLSLTYVFGYEFRAGIKKIRSMTTKPLAMNALIEKSSKRYVKIMSTWVDIALEEGILFFISSLGNPRWVVERVHAAGGKVYHDVTESKWAQKAKDAGVDGLIAVNNRAGGHAGSLSDLQLITELKNYDLPLICAGGVSTTEGFHRSLSLGYGGVQMGTRFIATQECHASEAYKQAIVRAGEHDIALTERITGLPVAVIRSSWLDHQGLHAGRLTRSLLRHRSGKYLMRSFYALKSLYQLKRSAVADDNQHGYWQAGKSVAGIHEIASVRSVVAQFAQVWRDWQ